jgi:hypothetical protein
VTAKSIIKDVHNYELDDNNYTIAVRNQAKGGNNTRVRTFRFISKIIIKIK